MKSLLERLELEVRLVEALLVATEEERLALSGGDLERIMACTERKKNILQAYESLGISRDHLLERMPGGRDVVEGRATLEEYIERKTRPKDPIGVQLREALTKLRENGRRLQRMNTMNGVLFQRALDLTVRTRAAVTGDTGASALYGRRGQYRGSGASAAVFRGRG
jgi:flagellar biosynthesis/type III secretory pathway chaperone